MKNDKPRGFVLKEEIPPEKPKKSKKILVILFFILCIVSVVTYAFIFLTHQVKNNKVDYSHIIACLHDALSASEGGIIEKNKPNIMKLINGFEKYGISDDLDLTRKHFKELLSDLEGNDINIDQCKNLFND